MADLPRRSRWLLVSALLAIVAVILFFRSTPPLRLDAPTADSSGGLTAMPVATTPALTSSAGQQSAAPAVAFAPNALFTYAERSAGTTVLDTALPAPAREIHYVKLNTGLIEGKQSPFWQQPGVGRFELPLPDGRIVPIVIDATENLGPVRFTSVGRVEGRPGSRAVFAYNDGFLHASVEDVDLGTYALRAATEELSQFYQIDPVLIPPCGGSASPALDRDALETLAKQRTKVSQAREIARDTGTSSGSGDSDLPPTAAAAGTNVEMHLMVVFTQAVLPTMSGAARTSAILSAIDAAVAGVNADFQASLINARVKLVKTAQTQYDSDSLSEFSATFQGDALNAVRETSDGTMDEIHALRDGSGADLVCLLVNRSDGSGTIGTAYILKRPGDNFNPIFAFSVVRYANISAGEHVLSHELGHNLGCDHERGRMPPSSGAYSYSYGYRFTGQNGLLYHDIMAYDPGIRLGYFSTPNVIAPSPINRPVGIAAGQPNEADTARTIEQSAFETAAYRLQTEAAYSVGLLQAVSTRAFVGPGEQALIGGFIITDGPKTVLLRGAGPALEPFLSDYLRDPVLTLFNSAGQPMETNNDWTTRAEAGLLGYTTASKDAGMQLTLPPGGYTVHVTAADGGTGTARIDAYEADSSGARLYALSSRAFADSTRPMIGGFVVSGASGTTKRMLIRVRGPSIAGVTAMDDPYMEIYNVGGELVMLNDDWSSGNVQGDDFRPLIAIYKEKQIANSDQVYITGLAPENRREPAVIADFAPGTYTVVVKPFERLPDQVAKPGVAAVDVFEVLPK